MSSTDTTAAAPAEEETAAPIVDADVVDEPAQPGPGTEVVQRATLAPSIFRTDDPLEIMQETARVAEGLKEFIKQQSLTKQLGDKDYILVEGWQMLGMMLGITPSFTTRDIEGGVGARCVLKDRSGHVVGEADAVCMENESQGSRSWGSQPYNARLSMAQTRAEAKAYRGTFGFVAKAAGFEATPAEEVEAAQASSGPRYGPKAAEKQLASARAAIGYLFDVEDPLDPSHNAVGAVLNSIESGAGGYLPHFTLASIARVAMAVRARRTGEEEAPGKEGAPDPEPEASAEPAEQPQDSDFNETEEERQMREHAEQIAAEELAGADGEPTS